MKNQHLKHILELNLAMLFISTSGVLGRYISVPPPVTIWLRCVLAAIIIGFFCWQQKISLKIITKKDFTTITLSGLLLGIHWITYFYSLQLSSVAIAMLSLFTYPILTTFLEPIFFKNKLNVKHVLLGCIVLIGIYFLSPELSLKNTDTQGILWGLFSAFTYALRNIIVKKKATIYNGSMLMFYQVLICSFLLIPVTFVFDIKPTFNEWQSIIALALFTTTIGHTLFIRSLKKFSVSSASIMSGIQPIYGILLGVFFLNEVPNTNTVIGGIIILSTVVIESIQSRK